MAKMKQTWLSSDGDEHPTEREADIRDLVLISDSEIDAWLASQEDMSPKRKIEYARVLKRWERERIEREFNSTVVSAERQKAIFGGDAFTQAPVDEPPYIEESLPEPQDGDADFGGAVVLKV
jgi:hypothetical protein